jgi:polyisoprenoid-binding protein YceI
MSKRKWLIDADHSDVQFKIKHMVISNITGAFNNFQGGATTDRSHLEDAEVHLSVDVNSIDTNQELRDAHLRSADFFDTAQFPHIDFKSLYFRKIKGDKYSLTGNLTMKGITKPVELLAEYGGTVVDPNGKAKIGFEVTGAISRWEFGLSYNAVMEAGGFMLGEEVALFANIQLVEQ